MQCDPGGAAAPRLSSQLIWLPGGGDVKSLTLELQNLTDAKAFDNFGVQRPGRAFYAKVTANLP